MTRTAKIVTGAAVFVALSLGALAVVPRLLFADRADYSQVVSIERAREYQDPALLEKAWSLPVAKLYREGFESQHNKSSCGPTSVVDVLHSLGVAKTQDTVLQGTPFKTYLGMLPGGLTLDQLSQLAAMTSGKQINVLRDQDLAAFRAELPLLNDPSRRYIANFSRGPLFARGGGHHSPLGGYLAEQDLILVLDVNGDFRPWLVKPERLWEAMNTTDRMTGLHRGLLVLR